MKLGPKNFLTFLAITMRKKNFFLSIYIAGASRKKIKKSKKSILPSIFESYCLYVLGGVPIKIFSR
jgi:hypothetical protein